MKKAEQLDALFQEAVNAIDVGRLDDLERILKENNFLVEKRLTSPGKWLTEKVGGATKGFFKNPYLLWFVAEDPVRNNNLPANIASAAAIIINFAREQKVKTLQKQLDYALMLVSWSWVAKESGVQIALIDVLVDAGASLEGTPDAALVNSNFEAADHLVNRGAKLTLATAVSLGRFKEAKELINQTPDKDRQMAFTMAALKGKADGVKFLMENIPQIDINKNKSGLYEHASPVHHAVDSGSLEAVKLLVEAGANLKKKDKIYEGTPLDWAIHLGKNEIVEYLKGKE